MQFGLKQQNVQLKKILRESSVSRYIRYLQKTKQLVSNMERGLLLNVEYDSGTDRIFCKFYDLTDHIIKIWLDPGYEMYCFSKLSEQKIRDALQTHPGFAGTERVIKTNLITDSKVELTKIYGKTLADINGTSGSIGRTLKKQNIPTWESNIRHYLSYIFDKHLNPGLIYSIKGGVIEHIDFKHQDKEAQKTYQALKEIFTNEAGELQEHMERRIDIFIDPIPAVKRLAFDIEVEMPDKYNFPNPKLAEQRVISIAFFDDKQEETVYVLNRKGLSNNINLPEQLRNTNIKFFDSEKELITQTFKIFWEYPVIFSYNGDGFDLLYLYNRAKKLKIDPDLNPIYMNRGMGILAHAECELLHGVHIDLFNLFFNRSISSYAFAGKYESASLDNVSAALLGEKKVKLNKQIYELPYEDLIWYNLKDAMLTLQLTEFDNSLVWNLLILVARITQLPIHESHRRLISTWIQNMLYAEHRHWNYLIPRRGELMKLKPGGQLASQFDKKKYQGALVLDPVPGRHYNVVVMDFASLYPSIIKEYNLSYETISCPHPEHKHNFVSGTPYHICTKRMGITSYMVGFIKDVRVHYFKPKGNDTSLEPELKNFYKSIEQALKVFINGAYGIFGSENFSMFCLPVAESTTGIGQHSIKATVKKAEQMGIEVLYGDTDSVFLSHPTEEQILELTTWSKKTLDLDLEAEKTYQFLALSNRKKHYIGVHKNTQHVDLKGLMIKKSNTPDFIKKTSKQIVELIKQITCEEDYTKTRKHIIKIIQTNRKKIGTADGFTLDDYVISVTISKNYNKYIKTIPQHVRAIKEYLQHLFQKFADNPKTSKEIKKMYRAGSTVRYIKTRGKTGAKIIDIAKLQDVNVEKYQELLKSAFEQLLEPLNISFAEIKGDKRMDAFFT